MKFGIIGTGMMADTHAQAIRAMANCQVQSVMGRSVAATRELAGRYEAKPYCDLDEFLADPELDVVTIATPSGSHLEPALAAAKAGKHVVVERPLELTLERADRMIEACEEARVVLSGILTHRFSPAVDALKTAAIEGRFGTLTLASAAVKTFLDRGSRGWKESPELGGGGAFMNEGIDAIDLLLYLVGDVAAVCASTASIARENKEVEDTGVALLEFRCGARGAIQCASSCWSSRVQPTEIQMAGESGLAVLVGDRFRVWDFQEPAPMDHDVKGTLMWGGESQGASQAQGFAGHQRNLEDVVQAIREERLPTINGPEARRALALIRAIYESARSGSRVGVCP